MLGEVPRVIETTPEAYALYLQSQFLIEQRIASSYLKAEAINKRVLEIDPEYAPAWSQQAALYYFGTFFGAWEPDDAIPRARNAALKSLGLFENNAQAHAILVHIAIDYDYDYELAARELEIALGQGPDNPIVLRAAAEFEQRQGNLEEAIRYIEKAHAVDPLGGHRTFAAIAYFYSGRQAEGISLFEEAVEKRPFSEFVRRSLAQALLETGDVEGALTAIEKEPAEGQRLSVLALIYETIGERERSTEALEKLIAAGRRWTWEITEVHAYRGELDEAFEWIDHAIERRDGGLRHVMYSPYLDKMREDPRFDDVLVRLGLKPGP